MTLAFFIVLPVMQTISKPPGDMFLTPVALGQIEPPPPTQMTEEAPPELIESDATPLSLDELSIALNPSFSEGWMGGGDVAIKLNKLMSTSEENNIDEIFYQVQRAKTKSVSIEKTVPPKFVCEKLLD